MTEKKRRIGLIGGTFNPIHNGHLLIAENALDQYRLDKVYFIPTGPSPHKEDALIAPPGMRCDMIQRAISDHSGFEISTIETDSVEKSYTYRTLEKLTETHPENAFFFIMGGDSVYEFSSWKNPKRICELCTLLVAVRDGMDKRKLKECANDLRARFHAEIELLDTPNVSISSREIRERIRKGLSIRYLVPQEVQAYIKENHLYE
mgnify:CR=1 FL=1